MSETNTAGKRAAIVMGVGAVQGLHVGHVIADGGIDGDRLRSRRSPAFEGGGEDVFISPPGLTDAYWCLRRQPKRARTFELDHRTGDETW